MNELINIFYVPYVDARREGYDHWESLWFALCDATAS